MCVFVRHELGENSEYTIEAQIIPHGADSIEADVVCALAPRKPVSVTCERDHGEAVL